MDTRNPTYTLAGSLPISEVGRKIRESRSRLAQTDAVIVDGSGRKMHLADSAQAWKVWAVCCERTASWSKGSDRVHVSTIANLAGLRADKVSPILKAFAQEGIFGWSKETGSRSPGLLSLPSLAEPSKKPAQPKRANPRCPDHPDEELYLYENYTAETSYVAKIVNGDGSAWCCAACTIAAHP